MVRSRPSLGETISGQHKLIKPSGTIASPGKLTATSRAMRDGPLRAGGGSDEKPRRNRRVAQRVDEFGEKSAVETVIVGDEKFHRTSETQWVRRRERRKKKPQQLLRLIFFEFVKIVVRRFHRVSDDGPSPIPEPQGHKARHRLMAQGSR